MAELTDTSRGDVSPHKVSAGKSSGVRPGCRTFEKPETVVVKTFIPWPDNNQKPSTEPGSWKCSRCGFQGYWYGGSHCFGQLLRVRLDEIRPSDCLVDRPGAEKSVGQAMRVPA